MSKDKQLIETTLINIAVKTGEIIESRFADKAFSVQYKGDNSPVTDIDILAQQSILSQLTSHFPGVPVVSEEQSKETNEASISDHFFIVDPLDSTKNFVAGIPIFDVSIALVESGKPIVSVIRDPIHKVTYSAIHALGSKANGLEIRTKPCLSIASADIDLNVTRLPDNLYMPLVLKVARKAKKVRYFGSAVIEICWIACGRLDAMINHDLSIWDLAACTLVLEEAGGFSCDLDGNQLRFDILTKRPILATGDRHLARLILETLQQ
jgi:myo-inositol-1(or 4)-monophosphatase